MNARIRDMFGSPRPHYVWRETGRFLRWLISQNAYLCHDLRERDGELQALVDGRGWFAPQWRPVPRDAWPADIVEIETGRRLLNEQERT